MMKKIFKIFFEKIPKEQLNQERSLSWKLFFPKSKDHLGLQILKVIFLLYFASLILFPLSILVAVIFRM